MPRAKIIKTSDSFYRVVGDNSELIPSPWHIDSTRLFESLEIGFDIRILTSMEVNHLLGSLFQQLSVGGLLTFQVADFDYLIQLWLRAEWTEEAILSSDSAARRSFSQIWGSQERGNPQFDDYSQINQALYKSGYNRSRLRFLLERARFLRTDIQGVDGWLSVRTFKLVNKGERQVAPHIRNIRGDHVARYTFAAQQFKTFRNGRVLDLACGVGYGSQILERNCEVSVTAVDVDEGAIEFGRTFYPLSSGTYICCDASKLSFDASSFDAVVCFETLEHVQNPEALVSLFSKVIKIGGLLVCSTPNQAILPFDAEAFPHHTRHFHVEEIREMLADRGFRVLSSYTQSDSQNGAITPGYDGMFSIVVALRVDTCD